MKTIDIKQQTPEWLEFRKDKIGASEAPVIMGVSPWKTPYRLWEEKLGLRESPQRSEAMQRGLELEQRARDICMDHLEYDLLPLVVQHDEYDWMIASLDGVSFDRKVAVEIKHCGREDHGTALSGKIPEKYYPQLQHQLAIINLDLIYYCSFDIKGAEDYKIIEVKRDESFIKKICQEELRFKEMLDKFEAPKLTNRDYVERHDEAWFDAAREWREINEELKRIKNMEKQFRERLIKLSQDQSSTGGGVKVQKIISKGRVDYSAIPELEGIDVDRYRKDPVEMWRIA